MKVRLSHHANLPHHWFFAWNRPRIHDENSCQLLRKQSDCYRPQSIGSRGSPGAPQGEPGRLDLVALDVSNPDSVKRGIAAVAKLEAAALGVDVLINNAGVAKGLWKSPTQSTREELEGDLATNLLGVVDVTIEALSLLRAGKLKKILTIGSNAGSFGEWVSALPVATTYSVSKAAVHFWSKKLSAELAPEGFTVMIAHPGTVVTDMNGGKDGPGEISPESVHGVLKYLNTSTPGADNGRFFSYDETTLPW